MSRNEPLPVSIIRRATQFGGSAYGSPIAVMHMLRELTEPEYTAAVGYERAYRDYLAAIDHRSLRTAKLEYGSQGTPPDADSAHGRSVARREAIAAERFQRLNRIRIGCGSEPARDFEAVVCAGVVPTWLMKGGVVIVCRALIRARPRKDARDDRRIRRR